MNKRIRTASYAFLILGLILTLIGTAMSSTFEPSIVNIIIGLGIALVIICRRSLRLQEDHLFLSRSKAQDWLQLKKNTGMIFCAIGLVTTIIATTLPATIIIYGITTNIATACGICIFLLGVGKIGKKRMLTNHNVFVVKVMEIFGYSNKLIARAQSMKGLRV